jgi:hypothetical protein
MVGMALGASRFVVSERYVVVATNIPMKRVSRLMKNIVVWKITPCSPIEVHRRFGGTYAFIFGVEECPKQVTVQEEGDKSTLGSSSVLLLIIAELFI